MSRRIRAIPRPAGGNEVAEWNITGAEAAAAGGQNSLVVGRTLAMMHLAIHDALNAIDRRYEPYLYMTAAEPSAAPGAAIATAAHGVLVGIIPAWGKPEQQKKALDIVEGVYADALAKIPDGAPKAQGVATGKGAAAALLVMRKLDTSDATVADRGWESFLNTPPLPDYPSTHSVAGGAAATVLARFFGTDQVAFQMTSGPPFAGITRSFASFSQAARENADSRVYAGIHFRSACRDGIKLGEQIGRRAFVTFLQPYRS